MPLLLLASLAVPSMASADTLGYPNWNMPCEHSPYSTTERCANYDWGPVHTEAYDDPSEYSSRGYSYRNCTDYVAWKLQSIGVPDSNTRGLGNAGNWYNNVPASERSSTPVARGVAVTPGNPGHVAFVESVNSNGTITVSEYNYDGMGTGSTRTGTASSLGFTEFIDFGVHPTSVVRSPGGNAGTLWFIKTKNTGSRHVEVHSATPSSGYQSGQHSVTWFSPGDADNGWFQMVGSDLYFIKTKHVGSGRVEVHSATAVSRYRSGVHYATAFSSHDADNGWFQMEDWNHDGRQDLVFIKTKNTSSGRVEFFVADGANGYRRVTVATPTVFSPADASNGWFQAEGHSLAFIKTRNTASGRVEFFRASAGSGLRRLSVATATAFYPFDQNNGWFSSEDVNSDGVVDEMFIKTHNPASGHVELFDADGALGYRQITQAIVTYFSPGDANNGWFQINSKQ